MVGDVLCHAYLRVTRRVTPSVFLRQCQPHDLHEPERVRRGRESRAELVVEFDGRATFARLERLKALLDPAYPRKALQQPTERLPGVGPKIAAALARKEIHCVEDLVLFLPRSYEDRRQLQAKAIASAVAKAMPIHSRGSPAESTTGMAS